MPKTTNTLLRSNTCYTLSTTLYQNPYYSNLFCAEDPLFNYLSSVNQPLQCLALINGSTCVEKLQDFGSKPRLFQQDFLHETLVTQNLTTSFRKSPSSDYIARTVLLSSLKSAYCFRVSDHLLILTKNQDSSTLRKTNKLLVLGIWD